LTNIQTLARLFGHKKNHLTKVRGIIYCQSYIA